MNNKVNNLFVVVGVLITGIALYYLWNGFSGLDKTLKATILTILGTVIAALIAHYQTKKREIESRHFAKKVEAYDKIFTLVFDAMLMTKKGEELDLSSDGEFIKKGMEMKKGLMIWGSSEAIKCQNKIEELSGAGEGAKAFAYYERLFKILRKDLGHKDDLEVGDLLSLVILAEDKESVKNQVRQVLAGN